ncbi:MULTISPECIES: PaaI family thioesterase [Agrobacterium]|uniref:PaaI family thioesterase n=1 Tax=Agrobacterium tumefaciens TaxID=358 RepID=A0AAE6EHY0_AGRTU|nr:MULTISPECIES: PaaI family thioesterase [Agrobacterium]QCL77041.1 PaaI family thioesterase [Agrobacterium tumefaciens]QCL82548.1 PaaI family thioesterase [Agrobacterium tumefaciens]CUX71072.1 conserved hypothetical protein [Agrobacterium sp. NCPPB 925]
MGVDELTASWIREEEEVRGRFLPAGVMPIEKLAERSGLETLNAIFSGELPPPPIGETLDLVPIHIETGKAVFQGRPSKRYYNPLGGVHGGWFATLLDSAVGCAIHSTLERGQSYTTLELKVNYIRPLTEKVRIVRAEGAIIHVGRQTATAEGRIIGPDGKLYAHASTTCLIFQHQGAKNG